MATTSLKLPDDVKHQAIAAAKRSGISPHAFMVEAIRSAAAAADRRAGFVAEAVAARKALKKSGIGYRAGEVHAYLDARVRRKPTSKPKPGTWRK